MSETGKLSKTAGTMMHALKNGLDLADTFLQVNKCLTAAWEGMWRHFITENHPEGSLLRNLYFPHSEHKTIISSQAQSRPHH